MDTKLKSQKTNNFLSKLLLSGWLIVLLVGIFSVNPKPVAAIELSAQGQYEWLDRGTIEVQFDIPSNKKNVRFVDSSPYDKKLEYISTDNCGVNKITILNLNYNNSGSSTATADYFAADKTCEPLQITADSPIEIKLYSNYTKTPRTGVSTVNPNSPTEQPAATNPLDAKQTNATCDAGEGFGLNWILCPVYNGIANFADWLFENLVQPLLRTAPISTDPTDPSYQIWSNFRVYGNIFLILALLVVVFGQSIGGGLVDAYTAKKVLPRLLAAAILINLSIYIVAFLVDITNIIGGGLGQLLTAPLKGAGAFNISPSGVAAGEIVGASTIALALSGLAGALVVPNLSFILLTAVLPAVIGLLVAFITLILRKAIILALLLVSPVAFALYCLPNTEKYFKKWWQLLLSTLAVYPIVVGIFAIADILSVTVAQANNKSNGLALFISFILQFLPLVFIPYAFKLAGGAIGNIAGILNGTGAKINGMAKGRKEEAAFRYKQQKAGSAAGINNKINNSALGAGLRKTPGVGRLYNRRTQRLDQVNRNLAADTSKTPGGQAIQHDDDALRAATYGSYGDAVDGLTTRNMANGDTREKATQKAVRAASAVGASTRFGRSQAIWATEQMGKTGTTFDDNEDMAQVIARAGGGNTSTIASLAGNLNSVNKQVGRHDLAPGFGTLNELALGEAGLDGGNNSLQNYSDAKEKAWQSGSLYQHANDKPANIGAAIAYHESVLAQGVAQQATATNPYDRQVADAKIEKSAVFFSELKVMSPNATGAVKVKVDEALNKNQATLTSAIGTLTPTPMTSISSKPVYEERQIIEPDGSFHKETPQVATRAESPRERIERQTRSFERVDPNHM